MRTWVGAIAGLGLLLAGGCLEEDPDFVEPDTGVADSGTSADADATADGTSADTTDGAPMCSSNETECSGECVDTDNSKNHCGMCGNKCQGSSKCVNGTCN